MLAMSFVEADEVPAVQRQHDSTASGGEIDGHESGGPVLLDGLVDLAPMRVYVRPGVNEIRGPQGGEVGEDRGLVPAEPTPPVPPRARQSAGRNSSPSRPATQSWARDRSAWA
jgi:hypothetical protein